MSMEALTLPRPAAPVPGSTAVVTVSKEPTLDASHRCDSCGAQAYTQVFVVNGDLLFCGHHFGKHESALMHQALSIIDERSFLVAAEKGARSGSGAGSAFS